jgi:two-component system, NarL family, nitrate/nitrite response regulator NarL
MVETNRSMSQHKQSQRRARAAIQLPVGRAGPDGANAGEASTRTSVLLAGGQAPTRALARAALRERGLVVAAEAADADSAVQAARRERPDVCLLDTDLPGGGMRTCSQIKAASPGTAVVMYTDELAEADFFDALRAGASGYLPKTMDVTRLASTLDGVLRGEAALPRNLVARLIEEFRAQERRERLYGAGHRGVALTAREWDVLEFMREGLSTAEMAALLYVSSVTIRTHVSAILRKLQVPDRAAAVRLLVEAS